MALSPEQQRELNKLQREFKDLQERIAKNGRAGHLQAARYVELEKKVNNLLEEQLKKSRELLSLEQQEAKLTDTLSKKFEKLTHSSSDRLGIEKKFVQSAKDEAQIITQIAQQADSNGELSKKVNDLAQDQLGVIEEINAGQLNSSELKDLDAQLTAKITDEAGELSEEEKDILKSLQRVVNERQKSTKIQKVSKNLLGESNELLKKMGDSLKDQATKYLSIMGIITIIVDVFKRFNASIGAAGKEFGALGMRAAGFQQKILDSSASLTRIGASATDLTDTVQILSGEFGIAMNQATDMGLAILDSSKAMGLTNQEGTKLFGLMMSITDMNQQQTEALLESTAALAMQNGVAPNAVMRDIANNGEYFAMHMKDGGKNILMAAIQAKKLGIDLSKVSNIAKGLLDFESSLNAEMEASVMIGRRINLDKARQLALTGDHKGMMDEVLRQLGGEAEFNKLNVLQREKLAQAVNMQGEDLAKLIDGLNEEKEIMGEIDEQNAANNITAEETLTKFDKMLNDIRAMGDEIAKRVGPGMGNLVASIAKFVGWLSEGNNAMNMFSTALALSFGKTMMSVAANIALAVTKSAAQAGIWGLVGGIAAGASMWSWVQGMVSTSQSQYAGRSFATGGSFMTSGPESILVGDNPGGRERVDVTPVSSANLHGPQGDIIILREIKHLLSGIKDSNNHIASGQDRMRDEHERTFGVGGLMYSQGMRISEVTD